MAGARPRVVLLGDSITQQSFSVERLGWGAALADWLQMKADVVNRGASGYNTRWTLPLLPQLFPATDPPPAAAIVFFGANDAVLPGLPGALSVQHVPLAEYEANLSRIVAHIRGVGCPFVYIVTPPPVDNDKWVRTKNDAALAVPGQRSLDATAAYAAAARRAAAASGAQVVELHEALLTCGTSVAELLHDGLHFAAAASSVLARLLVAALSKPAPAGPALADLPFALPHWSTYVPK